MPVIAYLAINSDQGIITEPWQAYVMIALLILLLIEIIRAIDQIWRL